MRAIRKAAQRTRSAAARLFGDRRGIAATEFSVLAPLMLVALFGVIEITNGVSAYRKVTIMAHTLSDLTSQSASVYDADLTNFFAASTGIMTPYYNSANPNSQPPSQTITEIWVNADSQARVQWSVGSAPLTAATPFPNLPSNLLVPNTYIIYANVSFTFIPPFGYVVNAAGITLSDFAYTRPRQNACVPYDAPPPPTTPCTGI